MSADRITLKHLRAFRAVAHHGHFTRAAESIGVSQPALSALVSQLEDELSVRLLARTTRAVEITAAGRDFLAASSRVLTELDHAVQEARDYAELKRGRLRIAALPSLCNALLPELVRRFLDQHPGIAVSLHDIAGDEVIDLVETGQVDFGLGYGSIGDRISTEPLLKDRLIAIARKDLVPEQPRTISWIALSRFDIIHMSHGTSIRRLMEDAAHQAHAELRIVMEPNQLPAALAYARAGLGITVLSSLSVAEEIGDELFAATLVEPVAERTISILTRPDRVLTPAAATFLTLLREAAAELRASAAG